MNATDVTFLDRRLPPRPARRSTVGRPGSGPGRPDTARPARATAPAALS